MSLEKKAKNLFSKGKEEFNKFKKVYICKSCREVTRQFRNCQTKDEERALVKKECAQIRDLFRADDTAFRKRNVLKILFFFMNGYPVDFGLMECLKLCASNKFTDKRVGYLGISVLLDEDHELTLLVSHSIKKDLVNFNHPQINGVAISCLGNIASTRMITELVPEIEHHIESQDPYTRKKAALAATRAVIKMEEGPEIFLPHVKCLISSDSKSSNLTGITLLNEILKKNSEIVDCSTADELIPLLSHFVKALKIESWMSDTSAEEAADPFIGTAAMRALAVLVKRNEERKEEFVKDMKKLAFCGPGVLLEISRSLFTLQMSEDFAFNILSKLLSSENSNMRYVGLNEMGKFVHRDTHRAWINRHTNLILDCLEDEDPSIELKAFKLLHAVANSENIDDVIRRSLKFLLHGPVEDRCEIFRKLYSILSKCCSPVYHIEKALMILDAADIYADEISINQMYSFLSNNSSSQKAAAEMAFTNCIRNLHEHMLREFCNPVYRKFRYERVCFFIFGEYGHQIDPSSLSVYLDIFISTIRAELEDTSSLLGSTSTTQRTEIKLMKISGFSALIKLHAKLGKSFPVMSNAVDLILNHRDCYEVGLQQRALEYINMTKGNFDIPVATIFQQLPSFDSESVHDSLKFEGIMKTADDMLVDLRSIGDVHSTSGISMAFTDNILELFQSEPSGGDFNNMNQLGNSAFSSLPSGLFDQDFGLTKMASPLVSHSHSGKHVTIDMDFHKLNQANPEVTTLKVTVTNKTVDVLTNFELKVSVPKYISLEIFPPSSETLSPGEGMEILQDVILRNTMHEKKGLMLRFQTEYRCEGELYKEQGSVTGIPPDL